MTKEIEEKTIELANKFKELVESIKFPEETQFVVWISHGDGEFSHFGNGCPVCASDELATLEHLGKETVN